MRETRARRVLRGGIATAAGVVVLTIGAIGLAPPAGAQEGPPGKVELCHHTGSETNPIVLIEVANPSQLPAHFSHGDTFPVNGSCRAPVVDPDPDPDPGTTRVTVCHKRGNGTFHELTFDDDALPAHLAHGDIYPVPPGGCNGTPPPPPPPPPPVVRTPVVRAPAVAAPVTPAPRVVAAEASPPQELARTGTGLVGVELLLAASLLAVGALCLRHARRRQVPASWSPPELPFELSCPDLPVESSRTETATETETAAAASDDERWDALRIPALAGVGERARGAPPTAVASWLTRAGPPDDS